VAGKLDGKVAFITGAARGQGRGHAVQLGLEGADIIAVDICRQIDGVPYAMATAEDLDQTVKEVEALGRRIVARPADVRDEAELKAAFDAGVAELGPAEIVVADASLATMSLHETHEAWQVVIDVNTAGTFNTVEVALPAMIEHGQGGAIVLIGPSAVLDGIGVPSRGGSSRGVPSRVGPSRGVPSRGVPSRGVPSRVGPSRGVPSRGGLAAPKHGFVDLMRSYAGNLAPHGIRVNSVHPTGVRTPIAENDALRGLLTANPEAGTAIANALPVDMTESADIASAVAWLVSDEARYITGITLAVDAGFTSRG
jgi:NAD(P)-dependent dehydrogenase (short-subunit alcohol dehydrogenase family)